MDYRREIDGLRALAVIPVIFFHAGFNTFSGGFVGVDVFFVISGYLITSIIFTEKQADTFSLINFYERRARRILPALFFVMAVCIPFAWLWLMPSEMKNFSQSLVSVSLFASNFLFWHESGYFDTAAELKPLLHTWSLAVEEQYYVLFPLFLMITWRLGKQWIVSILVVVSIISLSLSHWGALNWPTATFFLLPTRGWELLIGSFIAVYFEQKSGTFYNELINQLASLIGLFLILYAVFAFSKSTPFPSLYALVPTIGTALIILFATPKTLVGKILSSNAFVGIGLISFSAYLWHQPLFAFTRHRSLTEPSTELLLGLSLVSIVLAYFSWRFIEQPFRRKSVINRGKIFAFAGISSLIFIIIGLAGHFSDGLGKRYSLSWINKEVPTKFGGIVSNGINCSGRDPEVACQLQYGESKNTIIIAGDSHARVLTQPVEAHLSKYKLKLIDFSSSGCPFFVDLNIYLNKIEQKNCNTAFQSKRISFLSKLAPSIVILHSRFSLYYYGNGFDNTIGGVEKRDPYYASKNGNADEATRYSEIQASFKKTVEIIQSHGHKVVIVGPVPTNGWDPISRLYQIQKKGLGNTHTERLRLMSIPYLAVSDRHKAFNSIINEIISSNKKVIYIDPMELFCSKDSCSSITEHSILYSDTDHLSTDGSEMLFKLIVERLGLVSSV